MFENNQPLEETQLCAGDHIPSCTLNSKVRGGGGLLKQMKADSKLETKQVLNVRSPSLNRKYGAGPFQSILRLHDFVRSKLKMGPRRAG